jgi:hypothetical protein
MQTPSAAGLLVDLPAGTMEKPIKGLTMPQRSKLNLSPLALVRLISTLVGAS